jgi:hypothetical protein
MPGTRPRTRLELLVFLEISLKRQAAGFRLCESTRLVGKGIRRLCFFAGWALQRCSRRHGAGRWLA